MIEVCGPTESNLLKTATEFDKVKVFTVTKEMDILNATTEWSIKDAIKQYPGISVHGSLPCTVWCPRQFMNCSKLGPSYAADLEKRREESREMIRAFARIAKVAIHYGGTATFEWPKNCLGWAVKEMVELTNHLA